MAHGAGMDEDLLDDEDPNAPMVDDYHFVNGADRNYDGKFMQWYKRIFYTDGRTKLDGSGVLQVAQVVRTAAEEIPLLPTRLALRGAADLRRFVDHLEHELIALARSDGWSWRDIARATGLSHTSLHRRFAQYEVPIPRRRP